jgi:hypothetical protein
VVALQGTLDTFALADVLRLLAATHKSGRLRLDSTRGMGSVWVDSGAVVGIDDVTPGDSTPSERLFGLLRCSEGSFTFDADASHPEPEAPADVEPLLAEAEGMLNEWRSIEAVVPSLSSWVSLVADLPGGEVTLDRDRWQVVTAVAAGASVGAVGEHLGLGEVAISRKVKELVEMGLAEIEVRTEPAAVAAPAVSPMVQPLVEPEPFVEPEPEAVLAPAPWAAAEVAEPAIAPLTEPAAAATLDPAPAPLPQRKPTKAKAVVASAPETPDAAVAAEDIDADDVARQLANLSPRAAKAVKAAAAATTDEEREAALAVVADEGDEPLNRGLLLKFLSSVRT